MSSSQQLSNSAGEVTGQVQLKKEEYLNNVSHAMNQNADHHTHSQSQLHSEHDQNNPSLISQASSTGGQVKNMAQGAADAVKNTLGMSPATNSPSSPAGTTRSSKPGSKNM
ncbi:hypothetical protein ISN45_Aa01g037250 [Arabidopsis thaliana x Arabidopsis arenosa]|uniref:Uncharacterized protein n=1 Tax=Arabidopsis thaliana x Arabidopsis arenosa TaxID=1240361 RepID=A0A8T2CIN9_9BRAS|nr:hypothetical protein ISN45_Aa01g037250 [Arabidopsis thaliana x Arabidopsis arenosa]